MAAEWWFLIGFALLLMELALPGLVVGFFGLAALTVAVVVMLGGAKALLSQLLIFSVTAVLYLLLLRRLFRSLLKIGSNSADHEGLEDGIVGSEVQIDQDFSDGHGELELHGVRWQAQSSYSFKRGEWAKVVGKRSLVLLLEPRSDTD